MYKTLVRSRCRAEVISYAKKNVSNYDHFAMRMILENTFDDTSKAKVPESYIRWYNIDRPLFFYLGIKSLRKEFPFVKPLQYAMLHPLEIYHKLASAGEFPPLYTNDIYIITLAVLNILSRKYIPELTIDYIPPRTAASPSQIAFEHCQKHEFPESFSLLAHRCKNVDVVKVSEIGLEFCKSIYSKYVPELFGDLLKHVIITDQALSKFNIMNFNTNTRMNLKHKLLNYSIPEDKLNISTIEPQKYVMKNWMSNFKFICKKWLGRTLLSITPVNEYMKVSHHTSVITPPNVKEPLRQYINTEKLEKALAIAKKVNTTVDVKYEYLGLNLNILGQNFSELVLVTKLRQLFELNTLELSCGTYFNQLFVIYKLPEMNEIFPVQEYDLFHLYESNSELTTKILINLGFVYVIGGHCQLFRVRESEIHSEGCICNFRNTVKPIISESNRMLYKDILQKYGQKLTKIFNDWILKLIKSDLPTTLIVVIHEHILDLFDICTWIGFNGTC